MALQQITGDAPGNDFLVRLESVEVAVAHLRRDLEANVKELTNVGIVAWIALVVCQSADILLAGPTVDLFGAWEL